jgi:hypothetical protein
MWVLKPNDALNSKVCGCSIAYAERGSEGLRCQMMLLKLNAA